MRRAGELGQVHEQPFALVYDDGKADAAVDGEVGTTETEAAEELLEPVGVMETAAQFMLNSCSRLYQVQAKT